MSDWSSSATAGGASATTTTIASLVLLQPIDSGLQWSDLILRLHQLLRQLLDKCLRFGHLLSQLLDLCVDHSDLRRPTHADIDGETNDRVTFVFLDVVEHMVLLDCTSSKELQEPLVGECVSYTKQLIVELSKNAVSYGIHNASTGTDINGLTVKLNSLSNLALIVCKDYVEDAVQEGVSLRERKMISRHSTQDPPEKRKREGVFTWALKGLGTTKYINEPN